MLRLYQIFGVFLLAALAWADFRGWSFGTEELKEELAAESRDADRMGLRARYPRSRGSIRNRSYRGGK